MVIIIQPVGRVLTSINTTNVVLNSIRLATPSVKVACGEGSSLEKICAEKRQFGLDLRRKKLNYPGLRRKTPICPGFRCFS